MNSDKATWRSISIIKNYEPPKVIRLLNSKGGVGDCNAVGLSDTENCTNSGATALIACLGNGGAANTDCVSGFSGEV